MNEQMKIAMDAMALRRGKQQPEARLQESCVNWFRYQYPNELLFAIPNGGRRDAKEAAHMKRTGVLAGVPDLCLATPRNGYGGMYIELKAGKNTETEKQVEVRLKLTAAGYMCVVCRTFDEFHETVKAYMLGLVPKGPLVYFNPLTNKKKNEALIKRLFEQVEAIYGYTEMDIKGNNKVKPLVYIRMAVACILSESGMTNQAVGEVMNRSRAAIIYYNQQVSESPIYNKELNQIYEKLRISI